jgi:hypothetical protein
VKDRHLMLTYVPFTSPPTSPVAVDGVSPAAPADADATATTAAAADAAAPPPITPLIYCGVERSSTEDRDGYVSLLYNVLVSSAYFERTTVAAEDINITDPTSINKVSFI